MTKKQARGKNIAERRAAYKSSRPTTKARARGDLDEPSPEEERDWEWLQSNYPELEERYAGRWVAIANQTVVGSGATLAKAGERAERRGIQHPLFVAFRAKKYQGFFEVAHCHH